jgi:hypothetical protein
MNVFLNGRCEVMKEQSVVEAAEATRHTHEYGGGWIRFS